MKEVKKESKTKSTVSKKTKLNEEKKEVKVKSTRKKATTEKIDKALLNKKEQNNYSVLSQVIYIVSKFFRICLMIFLPFIVLSMVFLPIIFKRFEVSANIIKFDNVSVIVREDGISAKLGDNVYTVECNTFEFDKILTFLSNNPKPTIIFRFEVSLLILSIVIILAIYLLNYIESLFKNFITNKTPFTKENTNYVLKIAIFLLALKVASFCFSVVGVFTKCFVSINILSILIMFAIYYIFKYATNMQEVANTKMTD